MPIGLEEKFHGLKVAPDVCYVNTYQFPERSKRLVVVPRPSTRGPYAIHDPQPFRFARPDPRLLREDTSFLYHITRKSIRSLAERIERENYEKMALARGSASAAAYREAVKPRKIQPSPAIEELQKTGEERSSSKRHGQTGSSPQKLDQATPRPKSRTETPVVEMPKSVSGEEQEEEEV